MPYDFENISNQITPAEARELAMNSDRKDKDIEKCIRNTNYKIKKSAERGNYCTDIDTSDLDRKQFKAVRQYFKSLGYKVSFFMHNDGWAGTYADISWE